MSGVEFEDEDRVGDDDFELGKSKVDLLIHREGGHCPHCCMVASEHTWFSEQAGVHDNVLVAFALSVELEAEREALVSCALPDWVKKAYLHVSMDLG
jgi:hypothetical protein